MNDDCKDRQRIGETFQERQRRLAKVRANWLASLRKAAGKRR